MAGNPPTPPSFGTDVRRIDTVLEDAARRRSGSEDSRSRKETRLHQPERVARTDGQGIEQAGRVS